MAIVAAAAMNMGGPQPTYLAPLPHPLTYAQRLGMDRYLARRLQA